MKLKLNKKIIGMGIIAFIVIILLFINYNKKDENITFEKEVFSSELPQIPEEIENSNICVHISGGVRNPGIVVLDGTPRIIDAIEAAGGLTEMADVTHVNLAYILSDGIKIYIPKIDDVKTEELAYLSTGSGENVVEETVMGSEKSVKKVNINFGTVEELQSLNGIGESIAKRIVDYRKANGKFKSIDEIKNVAGIGNAKFESIKNEICVK